ncbi:peptidoglycan editing factor PgeF [Siminovitchia sediminis]|uniref:Purine nucleoside phosphorylase n=1 Tax=Siminovitchia sediminis TaxID=1274353 RepID=A0ABW4KIX5_9BACI
MKLYVNDEGWTAGITMKDKRMPEQNNMALHVCKHPERVIDNRKTFAASLGYTLHDLVCANQTHSSNFYKVRAGDRGRGSNRLATAIEQTDALYTDEPNIVLCSFTADCVPVMFFHEIKGIVGVVHSGWQGTVKEITLKLIRHLIENDYCHPDHFHIQIGPAISQKKFEVDEDVYVKFKSLGYADEFMYFNQETNKYHIDNQLTVKKQCELAGIPSEQIVMDRTCTYEAPDGFSYRQDKRCGRHLSFVVRKDKEMGSPYKK